MGKWNKGNYPFLGTDQDSHETSIQAKYARKVYNGRLIPKGKSVNGWSQVEGFSLMNSQGVLPPVSDVLVLYYGTSTPTPGTLITFSFTLNLSNGQTHNISLANIAWESPNSLYKQVAEAVNNLSSNLKAAYKSENVVIWYDDQYNSNVTISITPGADVVYEYRSLSNNRVEPIAYYEFDDKIAVLSLVTSRASQYNNELAQIWLVDVDKSGYWTNVELIYNFRIGWSKKNKPVVQGINENGCLRRLYVTDNNIPFKSFNLEDENIMAYDTESFDVLPSTKQTSPEIMRVIDSGALFCGGYQYIAQYITSAGAVSPIIQASPIVPTVSGNVSGQSNLYRGGPAGSDSGKSIRIRIRNIDQRYERIRVISIYRGDQGVIAEANILTETSITSDKLIVTDTGTNYLAPINDIDSLFSNEATWKYCKWIETHENALIASNLKNDFTLLEDFDSVVRFYNDAGQTYQGRFNPDPDTYKYLPQQITTPGGTDPRWVQGGESDGWNNNNGIRLWFKQETNIVDFNASRSDVFGTNNDVLNNNSGGISQTVIGSAPYNQVNRLQGIKPHIYSSTEPNDTYNRSFYADHFDSDLNAGIVSLHKGFQNGETYRLGIHFVDVNGADLFAKYMCDVRIPDYHEVYVDMNWNGNHQFSNYPFEKDFQFSGIRINNDVVTNYVRKTRIALDVRIPSEIAKIIGGYRIVMVERDADNRTVIAQGVLNPVQHQARIDEREKNNYGAAEIEDKYCPVAEDWRTIRSIGPYLDQNENFNYKKWWVKGLYTLEAPDLIFGENDISGELSLKYVQNLGVYHHGIVEPNTASPNNGLDAENVGEVYGGINTDFTISWNASERKEYRIEGIAPLGSRQEIPAGVFGMRKAFRNETMRKRLWPFGALGFGGIVLQNNNYTSGGLFPYSVIDGPEIINGVHLSVGHMNAIGHETFLIAMARGATGSREYPKKFHETEYFQPILVNVIRKVVNQYGGQTDEALQFNKWIPASDFVPVNQGTDHKSLVLSHGDIHSNMWSYTRLTRENEYARTNKQSYQIGGHAVAYPVQSIINCNYRHGAFFGGAGHSFLLPDNLDYNYAYSKMNDFKIYISKPNQFCPENIKPNIIAVSNKKINGNNIDAWANFPIFNYYELENEYGPVEAVLSVFGKLFGVQNRAISYLIYNPMTMIPTEFNQAIQLTNNLGEPPIQKHQYLRKDLGTQHIHSIVHGKYGVYFIDALRQSVVRISDNIEELQKKKYIQFFREHLRENKVKDQPLLKNGIHGYCDGEYDEIGFVIYKKTE